MSGHSKCSQIKRQKEKTDIKRGLTFTKLANAITIAVRQGGEITDPSQNFRLRLAIDMARASNMPKVNIDRAIQRGVKKGEGDIQEVVYEGFAPGGVLLIIEAATDNPQRTISEIKSIFNKAGASFGQPGSVSYQFAQMGQIVINKNGKSFEEIFEMALDLGAEDIGETEKKVIVYTKVEDLSRVRDNLLEKKLNVEDARLIRKPNVQVEVGGEQLGKIKNFLETINSLDDVQKVYSNLKQ